MEGNGSVITRTATNARQWSESDNLVWSVSLVRVRTAKEVECDELTLRLHAMERR